jgi:phage terminase large subunit
MLGINLAADRGEDKPQKIDDHVVDALRYAVNSIRV